MATSPFGSQIVALDPEGPSSTMFTLCCEVAICNDEPNCPKCKEPIIGHDAETDLDRGRIRWRSATRYWEGR